MLIYKPSLTRNKGSSNNNHKVNNAAALVRQISSTLRRDRDAFRGCTKTIKGLVIHVRVLIARLSTYIHARRIPRDATTRCAVCSANAHAHRDRVSLVDVVVIDRELLCVWLKRQAKHF